MREHKKSKNNVNDKKELTIEKAKFANDTTKETKETIVKGGGGGSLNDPVTMDKGKTDTYMVKEQEQYSGVKDKVNASSEYNPSISAPSISAPSISAPSITSVNPNPISSTLDVGNEIVVNTSSSSDLPAIKELSLSNLTSSNFAKSSNSPNSSDSYSSVPLELNLGSLEQVNVDYGGGGNDNLSNADIRKNVIEEIEMFRNSSSPAANLQSSNSTSTKSENQQPNYSFF